MKRERGGEKKKKKKKKKLVVAGVREEGGDGGREKSHGWTCEAGSGLRWRVAAAAAGTDANPSNVCLSVCLLSPRLFQVPGRRREANIRIHYFSELWAALTRDLFVQSLFFFLTPPRCV